MTEISGTTSACRSGWNTRTVSSMPGRSLRPSFANTARTAGCPPTVRSAKRTAESVAARALPTGNLQAMDTSKIANYDKIVGIFKSGKLTPESVIAQGTVRG